MLHVSNILTIVMYDTVKNSKKNDLTKGPKTPQALVPMLQFGCYGRNEMTMMVSACCQVEVSACTCT